MNALSKLVLSIASLSFVVGANAADLVCKLETIEIFKDGVLERTLPAGDYGKLTIKDYSDAKDKYTVVLEQPQREPAAGEFNAGQAPAIEAGQTPVKTLLLHDEGQEGETQFSIDDQVDVYAGGTRWALKEVAVERTPAKTETSTVIVKGSCQ